MAYVNRGATYFAQAKYAEAEKDFNQAKQINENNAPAYANLASILILKKEYQKALEQTEIAISIDKNYGVAYLNRGIAREMLRDMKGACEDWLIGNKKGSEESLNKLIELCGYKKEDFYTADDYYNLGLEENEKENYAAALISFSNARKLGYSKIDLLNSDIAISYYGLKEYEKGLKILNTIPKNTEQVNLVWITLTSIIFKYQLKDFPGAIKEAKEFISLNKLNPDEVNAELNIKYINENIDSIKDIYYYYYSSLLSTSDYDNSIKVSNQYLKIGKTITNNSFIGSAYYRLANAKIAKGDNLGAMQDINETLKIDSFKEDYTSLLLRAKIKLTIGSKKTACEYLNLALKYATEDKSEDKSEEDIDEISKLKKENCE